eukprot:7968075-Alexandrium_andersonii.AAC.1
MLQFAAIRNPPFGKRILASGVRSLDSADPGTTPKLVQKPPARCVMRRFPHVWPRIETFLPL